MSSGMHFGLRTLCHSCAQQNDKSEATWTLLKWCAAILIASILIFSGNSDKSKTETYRKVSGIATTVDTSNIRLQPSAKSEILGTVPSDSELSIIEDKGNWVKIECTQNGDKLIGWIAKSLINEKRN